MKKKGIKIGDKNIIWGNYMKKKTFLILSLIALISTFIFAAIFCIYHFYRIPSPLTILSLISIFLTFEYFFLLLSYLVNKFVQKKKKIVPNYWSNITNHFYSIDTTIFHYS